MSSDSSLWSERYSGTMADVFGIQDETARKIVTALQVKLSGSERSRAPVRPIDDPVAFDCYLRARQEMYLWTPTSAQQALHLVDQALSIVGDSPLLLSLKAQLHWNEVNTSRAPAETVLPVASELADRALAIVPDFPLAIFVRGLVAGSRGNPEQALPDLCRAHELWPGDGNILAELCRFANTAGLNYGALVERLA